MLNEGLDQLLLSAVIEYESQKENKKEEYIKEKLQDENNKEIKKRKDDNEDNKKNKKN